MSKDYTRVGEFGRRVTQDITEGKEKLEQKVINFERNWKEAGLKDGKVGCGFHNVCQRLSELDVICRMLAVSQVGHHESTSRQRSCIRED